MREQLDFLSQLSAPPAGEPEIHRCRTCGRPVMRLVTPNGGAPLPVDAIGAYWPGAMMWRIDGSFGETMPGEVGYNSHLATCGKRNEG